MYVGQYTAGQKKVRLYWSSEPVTIALKKAGIDLDIYLVDQFALSASDPLSSGRAVPFKAISVGVDMTPEAMDILSSNNPYKLVVDSESDRTFSSQKLNKLMSRGRAWKVHANVSNIDSVVAAEVESKNSAIKAKKTKTEGILYHVTDREYKPGDIIKGYWTAPDLGDGDEGPTGEELEDFAESLRPKGAPSRIGAAFAFDDMNNVLDYKDAFGKSKVYVVEPIGSFIRADMRCMDAAGVAFGESPRKARNEMIKYWSGKPNGGGFPPVYEIVANSFKVVRELSPEELQESLLRISISTLIKEVMGR